jgi:hypothetical protein
MDVEDAHGIMPIKLNDTQYNTDLEEKYKNVGLLDFYSKYIEKETFPAILSHAIFMMSLFGSTYVCEQLFFQIKNVKSKVRTRMTEVHLENSLRIASSHIKTDIDKSAKQKLCQISR